MEEKNTPTIDPDINPDINADINVDKPTHDIVEEYKVLEGFDEYEISSIGNLRKTTNKKVLLLRKDKDGYWRTNIYKDGKPKTINIHRLVAQHFVDNPENKRLVDHIDRNNGNNIYTNLRWATSSENSFNSKINTQNHTGYKGISFITSRKKFQLMMTVNGKNKFMGYFDTKEAASDEWNRQAPTIYKDFQPIGINISSI